MEISTITGAGKLSSGTKAANQTSSIGNNLPSTNYNDTFTISESGQARLARINNTSTMPQLISGNDAMLGLGVMALGGEQQLEKWREKGLEITKESLMAASKAFQSGFKELMDKRSSKSEGLSINGHQIVMNSQSTPEWFNSEYKTQLSLMGDSETKKAFEQGAIYHLALHNTSVKNALNTYTATGRMEV